MLRAPLPSSIQRSPETTGERRAALRYGACRRAFNGALLAAAALLALGSASLGAPPEGPIRILAFGDSLTAGYGLAEGQGFVPQLQAALTKAGIEAEVIDGGVSGDTTAGGLARLDWALADKPDIVILELGANDGLRGLDPAETEKNLDAMLSRFAAEKIPVLFAGMYAPPNFGPEFAEAYNGLFPRLAEKHTVAFYPFFLDGVAMEAALNQADGLHPNEQGVAVMVERLLPYLLRLIEAMPAALPANQG